MIKKVIPLAALILSGSAIAQVGIGTKKAASSAQLEVVASKKGVLLPRVELINATKFSPIEGEQVESLLVYHTGNNTLNAGFYYWRNNAWTPLLSGETIVDRMNNTFVLGANPNKNGEDSLIITDNQNHSVYLALADIASNSTFVTNLVDNNEFITKLGDSIDFINYMTNNQEFIKNIFNELKNKYGNVGYDAIAKKFYYFDTENNRQDIHWEDLNTTNVSFTLENDHLVVTDSDGNNVSIAVTELANNKTFVENIANNNDFTTTLGNNLDFVNHISKNEQFVENIVNMLSNTYGNVHYDVDNKVFYYLDSEKKRHNIDWTDLNTTNVSFAIENDHLVVTDSDGNNVSIAVTELANNKTFVENIANNNDFTTTLGNNLDFVNHISKNEQFVKNIVNMLNDTYGNVNYNTTTNKFYYLDGSGDEQEITWTDLNTTNVNFILENDHLVVTDSDGNNVSIAVTELANNKTFVENIANNNDFTTTLGNNLDFVNHISKNEQFVKNIVNMLNDTYGNVNYNTTTNKFYYLDGSGDEQEITWTDLNTTNVSFTLENDHLVVTDSDGNNVSIAVTELANNKTFVENIANNNDFTTTLGNNLDFVNHISNNEQFVKNIVNMLSDTYGNVSYNTTTNKFYYLDEFGKEHNIDWTDLNTTNVSFAIENDHLVVTDSDGNNVSIAVTELANNKTFVENIANNNDFTTTLGDNLDFVNHISKNEQFVKNIVNMLNDTYGNVNYNTTTNKFYYLDGSGDEQEITWTDLNTTNVSFTLENDHLVVTDSDGNNVSIAVTELANNKTFVENIANNNDFTTTLGNNLDFVNHISNNEQFVKNIVNMLSDTYGNVSYNTTTNKFYYLDEFGKEHNIDWTDLNTTNVSFAIENDHLVVTDSDGNNVSIAVTDLANNKTFVENIANNNDFTTTLGDNLDFVNHISKNEQFVKNIVNMLNDTYGNVNYNTTTNKFYYLDGSGDEQEITWTDLNTTNVSFTLENDHLVVTDSDGNNVSIAVTDLANNKTFVENIANNNDFTTTLGNNLDFVNHISKNEQFVKNIVNMLNDTYGNVNYNTTTNKFYYLDGSGDEQEITWTDLNTTNVSFILENDHLVVTDSDGNNVSIAVTELANNKTFVENIANNNDFTTTLGNNLDFVNHISNNEQFVENIVNMLSNTYGNVHYDVDNKVFYYLDSEKKRHNIDLAEFNTTNVSFILENDHLVVTDSDGNNVSIAVTELANNKTFVENIANNNDFTTTLGNNLDFVNHISNNEQFVENIVNMLSNTYGNVHYDVDNKVFYYLDSEKKRHNIDLAEFNTTNVSFILENDHLVVTDSDGNNVSIAVTELANNKTFVENIANNNDFTTTLGNNLDFVNHISNNEQFVENIVNMLSNTYGNVHYDVDNKVFYYLDSEKNRHNIDLAEFNTTNVSFILENDHLVVTDSDGNNVSIAVTELANNKTFVENIANNNDFTTTLGDNLDFVNHISKNEQFVKNIVNMLNDTYGNVNYNTTTNKFYYLDGSGDEQEITWTDLNTTNVSFTLENDHLVVTDSDGNNVSIAVTELANNKTFVENIANNNDFTTTLGNNLDFVNHISNNEKFVENIVNMLSNTYGNVHYDVDNKVFYYLDSEKKRHNIDLAEFNTTNVSFILENDHLVVTDSDGNNVSIAVTELANNKTFVENIANNNDFTTTLGNNLDFVNHISNNEQFVENIVNMLSNTYGNVHYDVDNKVFYYLDSEKNRHNIDLAEFNTTNVSFTLENDHLVVTDSDGNNVSISVVDLANNKTFVENIANNNDFTTTLGNNLDFVNHISNNEKFVENIVNMLSNTYGNVHYDVDNKVFYYLDSEKKRHNIDLAEFNTTNVSFTLENDHLVVTDSDGNNVSIAVTELANNKTFVENIANNNDFTTTLGNNLDFVNHISNNEQFVENIVNMLSNTYGNVHYDVDNKVFYYLDSEKNRHNIDLAEFNTTNVSFTLENDHLVVTDSDGNNVSIAVTELANNKTFVENIANNNDFTTTLGNNLDFVNHISNNEQFVENIVNMLSNTYGNVHYDVDNKVFYYLDSEKNRHNIDLAEFNTTNVSFTLENDHLVVTDSDGNNVSIAVTELANNKTFVENIANNNDFTTTLGNNLDFVNHISNNEKFVENIVNMLSNTYGNVHYDVDNKVFYYLDSEKNRHNIDLAEFNTTNVSFTLENDHLVVTDSDGNNVSIAVTELANNKTFVENIANNNDFTTTLGNNLDFVNHISNNEQFVENIVNMLSNTYGNVHYDVDNKVFYYLDSEKNRHNIDLAEFNTTNVSFTLENDHLVVTDSDGNNVSISVVDLANNKTFVENIAKNSDFITTLEKSNAFKTIITNNSAEATLTVTDETVNPSNVQAGFTFNNGKDMNVVQFEETLTEMDKGVDENQLTEYYFIDETGNRDDVIIQVTQDIINDFGKIVEDTKVKAILEQFISTASGNVSIVKNEDGDIMIKSPSVEFNLTEEIKAQETNTTLIDSGAGVYVYKNEEAIKNNGVGVTIDVVSDVQNNFQEIINNTSVKEILNKYLTESVSNIKVIDKDGDVVFVINEGGVEKEVNITKLIQDGSYVASLELNDKAANVNGVQAGFSFNDGKNSASKVYAETLTSLSKGADAAGKIEYAYTDETGEASSTKITVTQDIIQDFEKIIQDNSVKTLLEQFISTTTGDVSVDRNETGDLVIKKGSDIFNLTEEIRSKETLTSFNVTKESTEENGQTVQKNFLVYTPERGEAQRFDLTTLIESNETLTSLLSKEEGGANVPGVYIYTDENNATWELNIPEALKNSTVFNEYIQNLIDSKAPSAVNYSYEEEIKPGKWLNTTKQIATRTFDISLTAKTNIVQIPGDIADLILHARLINKATNSITEGIIRTEVVNKNTQLVLGIPGTLTVFHPVGEYYLILEYVKK